MGLHPVHLGPQAGPRGQVPAPWPGVSQLRSPRGHGRRLPQQELCCLQLSCSLKVEPSPSPNPSLGGQPAIGSTMETAPI